MRSSILIALAIVTGCGGPATDANRPAAASPPPTARTAPPASAARAARIRIPDGWTDLVQTPKGQIDALTPQWPGFYEKAHGMAERNGYLTFAFDLRAGSPDRGAMMYLMPYGRDGIVDQTFLDTFIAHNNLGLTADTTVEAKLLAVAGRPIAKWRTEYEGHDGTVDTLAYLFPGDDGRVIELVFVVRAERYEALRAQLEAIER